MSNEQKKILDRLKIVKAENCFPAGSTITAGVYLRQSTIDGQNSEGVKEQLEFINHRIKSDQVRSNLYPHCNISVPPELVFIDHGLTGRVEDRRQQYLSFKYAIQMKRFQVGLVFDLSRLTRELGSLLDAYDLAQIHGVELISVSELISSHSEGARNHFMFKGMVNEMQSESISRQTKRALELRALTGKSTGNFPYGYKSIPENPNRVRLPNEPANRIIVVDEEKASVIRRIYDLYANTALGTDGIARLLNGEKIPSPKGKLWGGRAIHGILHQPKYVGIWIHGRTKVARDSSRDKLVQVSRNQDEWIVKEWPNRQIVSSELWERVQKRLERIQKEKMSSPSKAVSIWGKSRGQANHLFTGTMCCGVCGGNFIVVSGRRGGYLGCTNAYRQKTCSNKKGVRSQWVEATFLNMLLGWITSPATLEYLCDQSNRRIASLKSQTSNKAEALQAEFQKVEKAIGAFVQYLGEGNSSDAVKDGLKRSEERKREIQASLAGLSVKEIDTEFLIPEKIQDFLINLDEILASDIIRANGYFRKLFPTPIQMTPKPNGRSYLYEAAGEVNLKKLVREGYSVPVNGVPKGIRTPAS